MIRTSTIVFFNRKQFNNSIMKHKNGKTENVKKISAQVPYENFF